MQKRNSINNFLLINMFFLVSACTPHQVLEKKGGFYHSGIYFGSHFPDAYKKGIKEGCSTSKGNYTKSHWLFQKNIDYVDGWFLGRNRCKNLLVLDDD